MKISTAAKSVATFLATATVMLFFVALGASLFADWMPGAGGLPVDIALVAE